MTSVFGIVTDVGTNSNPPYITIYHKTAVGGNGVIARPIGANGTCCTITSTNTPIHLKELLELSINPTDLYLFVDSACIDSSDPNTLSSNNISLTDNMGNESISTGTSNPNPNFYSDEPAFFTTKNNTNQLPYTVDISFFRSVEPPPEVDPSPVEPVP